MNLLGSAFYDPTGGAAVSKATTALLAMTALDTTNLRVSFTAPLSGKVKVVMSGGALHGAATYPFILLGVLSGASVIARVVPNVTVCGAPAATTPASLYAEFTVAVTPGAALVWDMAYGVEALVAATGLKYGGPNNNTTAGDAFGGISFSVFDASPIYLPAAMPVSTAHAKLDAITTSLTTIAGYLDTEIAAILAAVDTEVAAIKAKTDQLTFTIANKVDSSIQAAGDFAQAAADKVWSTAARSLTTFGTLAADVWASTTRLLTAGTNIVLAKGTGVTGFNDLSAAQVNTEVDTGIADAALATAANLAVAVGYIDTEVGAIKVVTDKLDTGLVLDGAVYQFTANALELGPAGGGGAGLTQADVRTALGMATANMDTQLSGIQSDTNDLQTRVPAALVSGRMDASVGAMAANVMTAAAAAADLTTELQAGLATASALATVSTKIDTVDDLIDTEVAAIKTDTAAIKLKTDNLPAAPADGTVIAAAFGVVNTTLGGLATTADLATVDTLVDGIKATTDQITFSVAGKVDANTKAVNDLPVTGAGTDEDPWGPA